MASMMEDIDGPESKVSKSRICGTHLHDAIANGDFEAFQRLVKDGAPMEIKNCHGLTPLQVVCTKKDVEMSSALLRYLLSFLKVT
jgi:ankyrin repeat protein